MVDVLRWVSQPQLAMISARNFHPAIVSFLVCGGRLLIRFEFDWRTETSSLCDCDSSHQVSSIAFAKCFREHGMSVQKVADLESVWSGRILAATNWSQSIMWAHCSCIVRAFWVLALASQCCSKSWGQQSSSKPSGKNDTCFLQYKRYVRAGI